jgi:hypothetical protein
MDRSKPETIRRLRFGDLIRLNQHRYGYVLPDDDAGREALHDLLCLASLAAVEPAKKMAHVIELKAPWMGASEAANTPSIVNRIPIDERWRIAKTLGERHRVTNAERERLGLRNILPCDMSKERLVERRKEKDRERKRRKRLKEGRMMRQAYLSQFDKKSKPWIREGVSRRTWFRRKASKALHPLAYSCGSPATAR